MITMAERNHEDASHKDGHGMKAQSFNQPKARYTPQREGVTTLHLHGGRTDGNDS